MKRSNSAKLKLLLICFCSITTISLYSQNSNVKKTHRKAIEALYNERYEDAQNLYKSILNSEPTNSRYNLEAGLSYYFSTFEREKSIPYFEAALQHSTKDTIPEIKYYLAKSYQLIGDYEKSNKTFNDFNYFIDFPKKSGKLLKSDIDREVNYNNNGIKYTLEENKNVTLENIGSNVNTKDREYAAVSHHTDNVIVFTSRRKFKGNKLDKGDLLPFEDIYVAKKNNENWALVTDKSELKKYIPENVNTKKHDASITYSIDGKSIYTYKKDAVWQSVFENGTWGTLNRLNKNVNTSKFNVPSVSITPDGNTLFFVATKKDGIGGKDIYKSIKQSNGEWDAPTLLNTNINTKEDEDAPFLSTDGKTLYFSSRGHSSIGGYDIFKSELTNGEWGLATNIGIPFNSPSDDIFYVIDEKNENGFLSTDRIGGNGSFDIYGFITKCKNIDNTEIRGIVYDSKLKTPIKATLTLTSKKTNSEEATVNTLTSNGKFLIVAKPETVYSLSIKADGYSSHTIELTTPPQCEYFQLFSELSLDKVEIEGATYQVATIRNSLFNRADINSTQPTDDGSYIPDFKDENDNQYSEDMAFMQKTRKLTPENQPNFYLLKDTVKIEDIVASNPEKDLISFEPIYFDFDKSNITKASKSELEKISSYLKSPEGKEYLLTITGHSDGKRDYEMSKKLFKNKKMEYSKEAAENRSKDYNLKLSEYRAQQVSKYLNQKEIKNSQINIEFVGENQPAFPNFNSDGSNNLENQSKNRRVTFKLTKQKEI